MANQAAVTAANGPAARSPSLGGDSSAKGRFLADDTSRNPSSLVNNVAGFGENLLSLTELQARLSVMELRQNIEAAKTGGAVVLAGFILAVAGLPLALAGIAELLVSELALKRSYALLIVSAAAIVIGGLCVAIGSARLGRTRFGFPLSGEEFTRNLNWLRTVLRYSGRIPSRR
jgi:hypothetical protein